MAPRLLCKSSTTHLIRCWLALWLVKLRGIWDSMHIRRASPADVLLRSATDARPPADCHWVLVCMGVLLAAELAVSQHGQLLL